MVQNTMRALPGRLSGGRSTMAENSARSRGIMGCDIEGLRHFRRLASHADALSRNVIGLVSRARCGTKCRTAEPGPSFLAVKKLDPGSASHRFASLHAAPHPGHAYGVAATRKPTSRSSVALSPASAEDPARSVSYTHLRAHET